MTVNVYEALGYDNREHYLETLAEDYGLGIDEVTDVADMLGEEEDFDGLIPALQQYIYLHIK